MRSVALATLLAAAFFALPQGAAAHATPLEYTPSSGAAVDEAPGAIEILFSERVEEGASGIQVYGPDGAAIELPPAAVQGDGRLFAVPFSQQQEGTYTVSWQVVSADDGHFTKGAFAFSVGTPSGDALPLGQIQVQHVTRVPQAAATGLELVGGALLIGAFGFFVLVWRPLQRRYPEVANHHAAVLRRTRILVLTGGVCAVVGALGFVLIKTLDLQDLRPGTFLETLKVFAMTTDGSFALARAALSLFVASVLCLSLRRFSNGGVSRRLALFIGVLLFAIVLARARVSHAAASEFLPTFSVLVNALQLAAKQWWVGGVVSLAVVFPVLRRGADERVRLYASALLSRALIGSLVLVAVSGLYIMWLHGKDPSLAWGEEWTQRALLVILAVSGMGLLRFAHMGVERVRSARGGALLSIGLPVEALLGIVLLFITGVSILTTPFYPGERTTFERSAQSQGARVVLSVHPYRSESFLVRVLDEGTGEEVALRDTVISLENPQEGIGPLVVEAEQISSGGFIFPRSELAVPGEWNVGVSARRPADYDATARFSLSYPEDVANSVRDASERHLGAVEVLLLVLSAFAVGGSFLLARFVRQSRDLVSSLKERLRPMQASSVVLGGARVAVALLALLGGWIVHVNLLQTEFQKRCEANGDFWIQSVPMRDYRPLAARNVTGCTLAVGLYHFASQEEYEFFRDDAQVVAQLDYAPAPIVAGEEARLFVQLSRLEDGRIVGPASEIDVYHDRVLHAILIGEDLATFAHIHPEDVGPLSQEAKEEGRYELRHTFPKAGRYVLAVDYVSHGVERQEFFPIEVTGSAQMRQAQHDFEREKTFGGYEVALQAPERFRAGEAARFSYTVRQNGEGVEDLQPYLAAPMHIFAVRSDLLRGTHTHGEVYSPGSLTVQKHLQVAGLGNYHTHFVPEAFGPRVEVGISTPFTFPTPGTYTVFGEFKHGGEVVLTSFTVEVE